jgi:hypothetical protein
LSPSFFTLSAMFPPVTLGFGLLGRRCLSTALTGTIAVSTRKNELLVAAVLLFMFDETTGRKTRLTA